VDHSAHHHQSHSGHDKHAGHSPEMFRQKFWLSLALTVPAVIFSPAVQGWLGVSWGFTGSQYVPAVFGIIIFVYGGVVFLKGAVVELADRAPGMMTLISLAISVAFAYSLAVTVGVVAGMDFWWELATLVTIMLLGHWLEIRSVVGAQGALQELAKLLPDMAELSNGHTVSLGELRVGDQVLVRPGAQVPIDGEVVKGESDVNESMLTGESRPVAKVPGSQVIGGTLNGNGALTLRVSRVGGETALAGIMKLVADAQASRSQTQILADRAAGYLTYVALLAAVATGVFWSIVGQSPAFILERVVTVLIIACPHALGLAIPLVTSISTTLAARHGILVRQRPALESARNVDVVLFDKTGTLTQGSQGVVSVTGDTHTLAVAAAAEAESEHTIGRAIVAEAQCRKVKFHTTTGFSVLPGRGVRATVAGVLTHVGGPQLLAHLGLQAEGANEDGKTVVYVVQHNKVMGTITVADAIREGSEQAVAALQAAGKRVAMLTGDADSVAAWVARELHMDEYFAEILPANKADVVKKLQARGNRVAMVGDGVNDAPALATADVGIAIGVGTDVAIESAGVVLASSDPRGVASVLLLSRATYNKMLQNLGWATAYNVITIPLGAGVGAAAGLVLSPAVGAVLMSLSTVVVAVNAQLLRRLKL
jgi:Cu2+-exporting ATPase